MNVPGMIFFDLIQLSMPILIDVPKGSKVNTTNPYPKLLFLFN